MMTKQMVIASLLMLLVLLLAGCGGRKTEAASSTPDEAANVSASAADEPVAATQGDPVEGEKLYQSTCVACHGPDASGVQGLGKSLHASDSEFVSSQTDDQLVEFIKKGRQPGDPGNTTGVAMPPKGGNPAFSDEDLYDIVAWLRTLE